MHGVKASLWGDTRTILNNYDLPMIPSNIGQKVEYNYNNKYFAQAAVTESYYNRYDNGRRWGAFWARNLSWSISDASINFSLLISQPRPTAQNAPQRRPLSYRKRNRQCRLLQLLKEIQ